MIILTVPDFANLSRTQRNEKVADETLERVHRKSYSRIFPRITKKEDSATMFLSTIPDLAAQNNSSKQMDWSTYFRNCGTPTQPSLGFAENGPEKRKYTVSVSSRGENVLMMPEVRGE